METPGESKDAVGLDLDKADFGEQPPAFRCAGCNAVIESEYWDVGGRYLCPSCKERVVLHAGTDAGWGPFRRAAAFGLGAALVSALVWWGIRAATGYELGLIAVVVGLFVGGAVRYGAGQRGGRRYQALAVFLAYSAVAFSYLPDIFGAVGSDDASAEATAEPSESASAPEEGAIASKDAAAAPLAETAPADANDTQQAGLLQVLWAFAVVLAIAYAVPFMGGVENILGILIIGFALWEAWKMNRGGALTIAGPYARQAAPPDAGV